LPETKEYLESSEIKKAEKHLSRGLRTREKVYETRASAKT